MIEPKGSDSDSDDDFKNFKKLYRQFKHNFKYFDEDVYGEGDIMKIKLLEGVLDRHGLIEKVKSKKKE